ncbi:uncharacterized serine-rich protein C1E8.05 [Drosophila innubila]|uniref:uncharacterized serine-rich protein C1E8.05 n=1 Tax=Drosophila innubila TaxID=198719 RepID=UPI00148DA594|nr:uncharacterized serine-rich protein C1E8.05 [Drosophila innubila]
MVYTERTDKYLTTSKDNAGQTKSSSSSPSPSSSSSSPSSKTTSSHSAGAWSSQASNAEKWKYNNMVKDDRDKFNSLHFS